MRFCRNCGNIVYDSACDVCDTKTSKRNEFLSNDEESIVDSLLMYGDAKFEAVKTAQSLHLWNTLLLILVWLAIFVYIIVSLVFALVYFKEGQNGLGVIIIAATILDTLVFSAILMTFYYSKKAKAINTITYYANAKINECILRKNFFESKISENNTQN